jgi:hypothetical protein
MHLKSFGCSFIFGSDLHDDGRDGSYATPSQYTWPALLAKDLGYTYDCYARPGAGNLRITEQVLNQTTNIDPAFHIVNWTWIDRFDYTKSENDSWATVMPIDDSVTAKVYYRDLHSQYRDKLTTLIHIKTSLDILLQKKQKFIMTYMDDLIFETHWHTSAAVLELQDYIRPHMTTFEGQSFLDWSRQKRFEISPAWHPLEEAHQAGFEYIKHHCF